MFSTLRNRFGIPGVISVIALVFAMIGGAYAASNSGDGKSATASAKKAAKGPRGPRGPKGATGAAGLAGPAGASGAKGDAGAAGGAGEKGATGANGTTGAAGKTVLSGTATPTAATGTVGDFYIETDVSRIYGPKAASGLNGGWGAGTNLKGEEGSPWTELGTLPSGATMTGTYFVNYPKESVAFEEEVNSYVAAISFTLPVEPKPALVFVDFGEDKSADGCPGFSASGTPLADAGTLCVYAKLSLQSTLNPLGGGVNTVGAFLSFDCKGEFEEFESPCREQGLWAVTAE
jgi:hypothetical protein